MEECQENSPIIWRDFFLFLIMITSAQLQPAQNLTDFNIQNMPTEPKDHN
jgi:hypothetical protein